MREIFEENEPKKSFFSRIKSGLAKTRANITEKIESVAARFISVDENMLEELEEVLILSDIGVSASEQIIEELRMRIKKERISDPSEVKQALKESVARLFESASAPEELKYPVVILVIGVNGSGKTTSIGKLAARLKQEGKSVMLAAADTFRAAAIDQLQVWAERANAPLIKQSEGSDPAAVAFDAVAAAKARNIDALIIDTAGRLHNKKNLMEELKKISKVIEKREAHKEVFLVLDGCAGQNAVQQAKTFMEVADISGVIITKLDGSAKGGVIVSIAKELLLPIRYVGLGEKIEDLELFDASVFARGLFDE